MKIINGLTTGLVVGTAIGIMVAPNFDKKTQRAIRRAERKMMDLAEDSMHYIK